MTNVKLRLVPTIAIVAALGASVGCGSNGDEGEDPATASAALRQAKIEVSGSLADPNDCTLGVVANATWKRNPHQVSITFKLLDDTGAMIVNGRDSIDVGPALTTTGPYTAFRDVVLVNSTTTSQFQLVAELTDDTAGTGKVLATVTTSLLLPCAPKPLP